MVVAWWLMVQIGWFGGGVVIDDGGAVEVGVVVGGEGVGLLVWVWVCCHGYGFGLAVGLGLGLLVVVVLGVCNVVVVGLW